MSSDFEDWLGLHTIVVHTPGEQDGWDGTSETTSTATGMLDARVVTLTRASDGAKVTSTAQFYTTLDQLQKFKEGARVELPGNRTASVVGVSVVQIGDEDLDGITVMVA